MHGASCSWRTAGLGTQTKNEFPPRFIVGLWLPDYSVVISAVQRLYATLCGEHLDDELDQTSLAELSPAAITQAPIVYNPQIPIDTFDVIIVDECYRSIYGLWRQVLDYFAAFIIGLTATPCF
jgi:type I restriction enzyme R subunit